MSVTNNLAPGSTFQGAIIASLSLLNSCTETFYYTAAGQTYCHINLSNLVAGSQVQIYDTTASSELYNGLVAGTSLDYLFTYSANHTMRIRVRKAGQITYETTGVPSATGLNVNVTQVVNSVYVANGIDGSTVSECSMTAGVIEIYINDSDNSTSAQRIYNWYQWRISQSDTIGNEPDDVTANTPYQYTIADAILIKNTKSAALMISGGNINNVSNNGQIVDTAGGTIVFVSYYALPPPSSSSTPQGIRDAMLLSPTGGATVNIGSIDDQLSDISDNI